MKKGISLILSLAIIFAQYGVCSYAMDSQKTDSDSLSQPDFSQVDKNKEARIVFGKDMVECTDNLTVTISGKYETEKIEGKIALKRDNSSPYVEVIANKDFLYAPEGAAVEIEVEYFDSGKGHFAISYDGINNKLWWAGATVPWSDTEKLVMTDSGEWKTYTFCIDDMRAMKQFEGRDFRLGAWTHQYGMTKEPIYISSINIKKTLRQKVLESYVHSEFVGNIFGPQDDRSVTIDFTNMIKQDYTTQAVYTVKDYSGSVVKSGEFSFDNTDGSVYSETINLNDITKFGTYYMSIHLKSTLDYEGEETIRESDISVGFSVINKSERGEGNKRNYICTHMAQDVYNSVYKEFPELASMAGFGGVRDNIYWYVVEKSAGQYIIPGKYKAFYNMLNDYGLDWYMCIGLGPEFYCTAEQIAEGRAIYRVPATKKGQEAFGKFCEYIAKEFPETTNFEIWNEPDDSVPEDYAKILESAYKKIKAVDKDANVIGMCVIRDNIPFQTRALDAGAYDYMDSVAIHPYTFYGHFDYDKTIAYADNTKKLYEKYGGEKPILFSELGGSTSSNLMGGFEPVYVGEGFIKLSVLESQKKASELQCWYDLMDDGINPTSGEHGFGMVESFQEPEQGMRKTAKPAYVAAAGYNKFMANAEPVGMIEENGLYLSNFKDKNGENIAILWADENTGKNIELNLGTDEIVVYDMFTNLVDSMHSEDGIYNLGITERPIYIKGNFQSFEAKESSYGLESLIKELSTNDEVTLEIECKKGDIDEIKYLADDTISAQKAIDGKIKVTSNQAEVGEKEITIIAYKDKRMIYYAQMRLHIQNMISVSLEQQQFSQYETNRWQARIDVKNISNVFSANGECRLISLNGEAVNKKPIRFNNLKPKQSISFYFNLDEMVKKRNATMEAEVVLDDGYTIKLNRTLDFTSAMYADPKPILDGIMDSGEWLGSWMCADTKDRASSISDWAGKDDLSVDFKLMWDEENLYLGAMVTDDYQSCDQQPHELWAGDSLQIGIENSIYTGDVYFGMGAEASSDYNELTIALTDEGKVKMYRHLAQANARDEGEVFDFEGTIVRNDGKTVYEIAIPWTTLFTDVFTFDKNTIFGFSMLVNDNDGKGRRGFIEYNSGIGSSKDTSLFGRMSLK